MFWDGADDLDIEITRVLDRADRGDRLASHLVPTHPEVLCDVGDGRSPDERGDVVPAEVPARDVRDAVEAIAAFSRQVDSADEGESVVDNDRLLVMAMQWTLPRVERPVDIGSCAAALPSTPNRSAGRPEERQWRTAPGKDANVDS